jgi:hypothetical protein
VARFSADVTGGITALERSGAVTSAGADPSSRRRLIPVVVVVTFAAPVAAYFWLLHHYAVNVVFLDQWRDVELLGHSYSDTLTFGNLWAQHGEHRIFVPNLVVLLLGHTTHMNIVVEEYLSALMLCGAAALLILAHRRRSPSKPWLTYCPVAILMLSLVQSESTLFGFQLAWYAVVLMLASTVFLLDRLRLSGVALGAAIVTGIVGSFCSLEGLMIWPAGLVLLYQRHRTKRQIVSWSAAAIATGFTYAYHFQLHEGAPSGLTGLNLPGAAIRSFFQVIGGVLGVRLNNASSGVSDAIFIFGLLVFLISIYALVSRGLRRDTLSGAPVGVALICFGLMYAVAFAYGRAALGPSAASSPQYTTFTLLIVVGCYLALLDTPIRRTPAAPPMLGIAPVVGLMLIAVMCLQVSLGELNGIRAARSFHQRQVDVALATVDIKNVPDAILKNAVGAYALTPAHIRSDASIMRAHHLAFFDSSDAVLAYREEAKAEERLGLFKYAPPPVTTVVSPVAGGTLNGKTLLYAVVRPGLYVARVDFHLTGKGRPDVSLGSARRTKLGWILAWDTSKVTNGSYQLESVAFGSRGPIGRSATISIEINNA